MVRKAVNVTAATARRDGLIDVVAQSERALLRRLDGLRLAAVLARGWPQFFVANSREATDASIEYGPDDARVPAVHRHAGRA